MSRHVQKLHQQGLSLVELMIAITLGLIVLASLVGLFTQNSRSFRQNDALAEAQDSARFALDALARDISMAGYYGGMYGSSGIDPYVTPFSPDCGTPDSSTTPATPWVFRLASRVEFRNQLSTDSVSTVFPCLGQSTTPVASNTDIVAIRRVAGQATADLASGNSATLRANNFYLKTNGTVGSMIHNGSSAVFPLSTDTNKPLQAPVAFYKYLPRIYFIRTYSQVATDGIPTLCRMELQQTAAGGLAVECLADGVENMQIEWGLDVDNDCNVDTYTSSPTADQLAQTAITARIWLLVRTTQLDGGYTDAKTFNFADFSTTAALTAGYHRRVYSTTVQLRNPIANNGPCVPLQSTGATR
jgi:Tfp pilus assembly protein PilW